MMVYVYHENVFWNLIVGFEFANHVRGCCVNTEKQVKLF